MAERRNEEERLDLDAADLDQALAEIDLKLPARRRLEPDAGQRLRLQGLPQGLNRPLQRPQAHAQRLLRQEILANDAGVAAMPKKALAQPNLVSIERLGPPGRKETAARPPSQRSA